MFIDPSLLIIYAICGALSYFLYNKGIERDDNGSIVIAVIIAAGTAISWFQWSGPYIILSAAETGLGVFLVNLYLSRKDNK